MKKITAWILTVFILLSAGAAGTTAAAERARINPGAEPALQEDGPLAAEAAEQVTADEDAEDAPAAYAAVTGGSGARTSRPAPAAAPAVQTGQVPVGYKTPQGFIRMTHQSWIRNATAEYISLSVPLEGSFTLFLNGVTEEEKDEVIRQIEAGLTFDQQGNLIVASDVTIKMPEILDAEKYIMAGYDSNLCWAATAANMLWQAGYAQQAINPYTGRAFASTDEVFDYFRHKFTDIGSYADGAIYAFLDGEYKYWNKIDLSQVKEGEKLRALLPGNVADVHKYDLWKTEYKLFTNIGNFLDNAYGIGIRRYDSATGAQVDDVGHDITVIGVIIDESATSPEDRYKALLITDSDTDMETLSAKDDRQRAAVAATYTNRITMFPLRLEDVPGYGKQWRIDYPGWNDCFIRYLYQLSDFK